MATSDTSRILVTFRERLLRDRLEGKDHGADHYRSLFPGFEEVIEQEFHEMSAPVTGTGANQESRIGPYVIERELGRGGQGIVYLAKDSRLGRRVALKVLNRRLFDSEERKRRFDRESRLASRLEHPGIATVYESGCVDDEEYVAMQYVEGPSLRYEIEEDKRTGTIVSRQESLQRVRVVAEVCQAVHAAHEQGVVHRDLKPANLIHRASGELVVLDFGLAADLSGDDSTLTRSGDLFGSPAYMAPEQIEGMSHGDARVDVYSLGVLLYEWITLQRPFQGATRESLFQSILRDEPPDLRRSAPGTPRDLALVLQTAMSKDLATRYQTVEDFANDLDAVAEGRPVSVVPLRPWQRFGRWVVRDPKQASLVLSLVALLLAVTGIGGFSFAKREVWEAGKEARKQREFELLLGRAFGESGPEETFHDRQTLTQAAHEHPELALVRVFLAVDFLNLGMDDDAAEIVTAPADDPDGEAALQRVREFLQGIPPTDPATSAGPVECYTIGSLSYLCFEGGIDPTESLYRAFYAFRSAILLSPKATLLFYLDLARATNVLRQRSFKEAQNIEIALSGALAHLFPDSDIALSWAGHLIIGRDRERAVELLRRAVELNPKSMAAMVSLAEDCVVAQRDLAKGKAWYARLEEVLLEAQGKGLKENPLLGTYPLKWANVLRDAGWIEESIRPLRMAVAVKAPVAGPYVRLAEYEENIGNLEKSRELLETALQLEPSRLDASVKLREVLGTLGETDLLRGELERRTGICPDDVQAWHELGSILILQGHLDDAWILVEDALDLLKDLPEHRLANLIELQGQIDAME